MAFLYSSLIEWFRRHKTQYSYMVQALYSLCGISKKQGHTQVLERQVSQLEKSSIHIRLMEQAKAIHLGMGLKDPCMTC